jgi:hypothetical protein
MMLHPHQSPTTPSTQLIPSQRWLYRLLPPPQKRKALLPRRRHPNMSAMFASLTFSRLKVSCYVEQHFYCNDCAVEVFHRSMANIDEFPASCCFRSQNGLPPALFEALLDADFIGKYKLRLYEYQTPEVIRVYCANVHCSQFKHSNGFDNSDQRRTLAHCSCSTTTCVGCKTAWSTDHVCAHSNTKSKPSWVTDYTASCRINQCPHCQEWIELSEACNHMSCSSCRHQFCFVCLMLWQGFHSYLGCPMYGDPI